MVIASSKIWFRVSVLFFGLSGDSSSRHLPGDLCGLVLGSSLSLINTYRVRQSLSIKKLPVRQYFLMARGANISLRNFGIFFTAAAIPRAG
jgi:hypothetical protein